MKLIRNFARGVTLLLIIAIIPALGGCSQLKQAYGKLTGNEQRGDIDLDEAIPLIAAVEAHPDFNPKPPVWHNLFDHQPGSYVSLSSYGGAIDPTGTTIVNDYDGDGIENENETVTNIWIADYPVIETSIATPVTMTIEILESRVTTNDSITSEINSDDTESTKNQGSEQVHQAESALKTREFQDSLSTSTSRTESTKTSVNASANAVLGLVGSFSSAVSSERSWSQSNAYSETKTKWRDVPFKNNLDRNGWKVNSDKAAKKARKFRSELTTKINSTSKVDANAGYVRAALYIQNHSVNMPVKLSNILCTLMFETVSGNLIPVQSFRLRNDDYSLFEIEVYGGSEFGPYVVELPGLNTVEIKDAIALGYSPKIFIVDYDMTHVPDSNYRSVLLNYSGENLKIIEENAKGRTAMIRMMGPGLREKFRVAAFEFTESSNICSGNQGEMVQPGISLANALRRIGCSGYNFEFSDFIMDLSDFIPDLEESRVKVNAIKSIGGIQTRFPVVQLEGMSGSYSEDCIEGVPCIQKPLSEWTVDDILNSGVWVVFSNGKYYSNSAYETDFAGVPQEYTIPVDVPAEYGGGERIPELVGPNSMVWVGDQFDVVYLRAKDLIEYQVQHGNNPVETEEEIRINTVWDNQSIGSAAFDPDVRSLYLGKAGFSEKIELTFKLDSTWYLNPNFGYPQLKNDSANYVSFDYAPGFITEKFNLEEAVDFELSLGMDGERTGWFHLLRDLGSWVLASDPGSDRPASCGYSVDYVNQEFTLCVQLPATHLSPYVDPSNSVLSLYLRPSLNSAYRNTVWPKYFSNVNLFDAVVDEKSEIGVTKVKIRDAVGEINVGDEFYVEGIATPFNVTSVVDGLITGKPYEITLDQALDVDVLSGSKVWVKGSLQEPDISYSVDGGYYKSWNLEALSNPVDFYYDWRTSHRVPLYEGGTVAIDCSQNISHSIKCLGFDTDLVAGNWMGGYNYGIPLWNSWADGGDFSNFLADGLPRITTGSGYNMVFKGTAEPQMPTSDKLLSYPEYNVDANEIQPAIDGDGDFSVAAWVTIPAEKDKSIIKGHILDGKTGVKLGSEFVISNTVEASRFNLTPSVSVHGSRAFVTWETSKSCTENAGELLCTNVQILGRVIDLEKKLPVGSDIQVSKSYPNSENLFPAVKVANNRAFVAWYVNVSGTESYTLGRILDISVDIPDATGEDLKLSDMQELVVRARRYIWGIYINTYTRSHIKVLSLGSGSVAGNGSKFLAVWPAKKVDLALNPPVQEYSIRYRFADGATGELLGTVDSALSDELLTLKLSPRVKVAGDRAVVIWEEFADSLDTSPSIIKARMLDVATNQPLGDITNASVWGSYNRKPTLAISGGQVVMTWESKVLQTDDSMIRGRVMSLSSGTFTNSGDFAVSTAIKGKQLNSQVSTNGDHALFVWEAWIPDEYDPANPPLDGNGDPIDQALLGSYDIRARMLDMQTGEFLTTADFLVSYTVSGNQLSPVVWMSRNSAFLVWQSEEYRLAQDTGDLLSTDYDIRMGSIDVSFSSSYGLNNFFVSPLIQREYIVQTRIVLD